jgi:hypothetical protein
MTWKNALPTLLSFPKNEGLFNIAILQIHYRIVAECVVKVFEEVNFP